jgi:signal transduction histidine kinase
VVDDGVGFDPTSVDHRGHLGIVSMREQAAVLGASLELRSTPGVGTTVEVRWP